jgi:hypothetical protein
MKYFIDYKFSFHERGQAPLPDLFHSEVLQKTGLLEIEQVRKRGLPSLHAPIRSLHPCCRDLLLRQRPRTKHCSDHDS